MTIKEFIEAAIEGGWKQKGFLENQAVAQVLDVYVPAMIEVILLDPEAWKAVGKTKGWDKVSDDPKQDPFTVMFKNLEPYFKMEQMIKALWEGKTLEEFIATL